MSRDRRGFALVAVLWVVVAAGALAVVARLAARDLVGSAGNRVALTRARWAAEGCAERARAAADRALREAVDQGPASPVWAHLDRELAASPLVEGCEWRLSAVGSRLDVNHADAETLRRLLALAEVPPSAADSLVDALLDWRDADDQPRPLGAEAEHYRGRHPPRNGDFADVRELARVRGMDRTAGLDTLLGVDSARVSLGHAPFAVLAALPGMSAEAASRLVALRGEREAAPELVAIEGQLGPAARTELMRSYPRLSGLTTAQPDGWVLEVRAAEGTPRVTAVIELRLVRAATRVAVVRKRTWME